MPILVVPCREPERWRVVNRMAGLDAVVGQRLVKSLVPHPALRTITETRPTGMLKAAAEILAEAWRRYLADQTKSEGAKP